MTGRVIMQDFTGVPAVVDLAALRAAMARLGGDPQRINPLIPADLVIDHSVQVDNFATSTALLFNAEREFERNRERYEFLPFPRTWASFTRSTWNTWPRWCAQKPPRRGTSWPSPIPWWAPIRTPP